MALAGAISLAAAGLLGGAALGVSVPIQTTHVEMSGKASPARRPLKIPTPLTMTLEGKISEQGTADGHPPALQALTLQFDRAGAISTTGLPICRPSKVQDVEWLKGCEKALVGHGEVEIDLAGEPESLPYPVQAPMQIFNGAPEGGRPVLIYRVYAHMPPPTVFLTKGVIETGRGRFGTKTTIPIPTIAADRGSIVGFRATLGTAWTYRGRKLDLLSAACPRGELSAHAELAFVSGQVFQGEIVRPCGVKGASRANRVAAGG